MAGARVVVAGLAVAAVAAGSAAAAAPGILIRVHARLAPATGTTASGRFDGMLFKRGMEARPQAVPRTGSHWRLAWRLSLPSLSGPVTATLRVRADRRAAAAGHVLCSRCTTSASGSMTLTGSQAMRIASGHGFVVVRSQSATLRGTIRAEPRYPVARQR